MALPGVSDEKELKLLLKKLFEQPEERYKFAVAAQGPKEGRLLLSKKEKLKRPQVQAEAETVAKAENAGKAVKLEVIVGECFIVAAGVPTLRVVVYGKAAPKAVACFEHLLVRGPYKTVGFTGIVVEEMEEPGDEPAAGVASTSPPPSSPVPGGPSPGGPAPSSPPPPPPSPEALRFAQRLKTLKPNLEKVMAGGIPQSSQAQQSLQAATLHIKKPDTVAAHAELDKLEQIIKQGLEALAAKASPQEDLGKVFNERLAKLLPLIQAAAGSPQGEEAKLRAREAGVFARKLDFTSANGLLDQVEQALRQPAGSSPSGPSPTVAGPSPSDSPATLRWNDVRATVVQSLNKELDWVLGTADPLVREAELELRAVIRQISGKMEARQQAVEMRRYLEDDDVVAEVCELAFDMKTPLLNVLNEIESQLPA